MKNLYLVLALFACVALSNKCKNVIDDPSFEKCETVTACNKDAKDWRENAVMCMDVDGDDKWDEAGYRQLGDAWYATGTDFNTCTTGTGNIVYLFNQYSTEVDNVKDGRQVATLSTASCTYQLCQDVKGLKKGKKYSFTFYSMLPASAAGDDNFEVTVNGKVVLNVADSELSTTKWEKFTAEFKSSGKVDSICFYDVGTVTEGVGALIDQVVLCA
eukprot:TRINITY_DN8984_c0_g1_i1.p1 TRINITY_DN8984_c0_g1~~TRINITY_DN8984_c0_g1_i1.p1  ORF type:complete len:215 (-),score=53.06 TRINITY_DN8984_c0_g1_i1:54-698(-)